MRDRAGVALGAVGDGSIAKADEAQPPAGRRASPPRIPWGTIGWLTVAAAWIGLAILLHFFGDATGRLTDVVSDGLLFALPVSAVWLGARGSRRSFAYVALSVLIVVGVMTVASGAEDRAAVEPCPSGMDYIGWQGPCPATWLEQALAGVPYLVVLSILVLPGLIARGACAIRRRRVGRVPADR